MRSIASYCLILGMGLLSMAAGVAGAQDLSNKLTSNETAQGWKLLSDLSLDVALVQEAVRRPA